MPVKGTIVRHASAVEELVRRHCGAVRGFLLFLGCPDAHVDDLVQDVFLSVLASDFEDRHPASTLAYLRTVAKHILLKTLRRERRQRPLGELEASEQYFVSEFEGEDGGGAYLGALRLCLQGIEGRPSEVIRMRYEERLRREQIAQRIGLSESGVKSILVRTRKRLRECVERRLAR